MVDTSMVRMLVKVFVVSCLVLVFGAANAFAAAVAHPRAGKLPAYPVIRGVVPVLGSKAAIDAHGQLVNESYASARARRYKTSTATPVANERPLPRCVDAFEEELSFLTQDMCYRGGPVVHGATVHLVFWQGPVEEDVSAEPHVKLFPLHYAEIVEHYLEDVAHDSGLTTNVFAVDPQYREEQILGVSKAGEYRLLFNHETDVTFDNEKFPSHLAGGCVDSTRYSEGPCLLDSDLRHEAEKVAGTSSKGLSDIYVVLTPPGVGGCFEASSGECAYRQYCAYHGDFGGDGKTPGQQTLYVDLPYIGEVSGCDSGVHPNEALSLEAEERGEDGGADAVIDTASHELNETVTDPIGSQCDEEAGNIVGCERTSWTDAIGQEVADKCLPPETVVAGIDGTYGEPLVSGLGLRSYNQTINHRHYWTQREWSNDAGPVEGGCVQRAIGAGFTVPSGVRATVPSTFDGSAAGAPEDPAVYWVWDFGDGERVGTSKPTVSHAFRASGRYSVTLTAYDAYGSSAWQRATVEVAAPPPSISAPEPITITKTVSVLVPVEPTAYTASQLASKLGLPANRAKLSGSGRMVLGHATCPPACTVSVRLYAVEHVTVHGHHVVKRVFIGALTTRLAAKGSRTLTLTLNAARRKLLRKSHALAAQLLVSVTGREGGSWQISRTFTLTR